MDQHTPNSNEASHNDDPLPQALSTPVTGDNPLGDLRKATINGLQRIIYGTWKGTPEEGEKLSARAFSLQHDPQLRRRSEAVELLGSFSERDAVNVLREVLLRGEKELDTTAGAGRWRRDTALLTTLRTI